MPFTAGLLQGEATECRLDMALGTSTRMIVYTVNIIVILCPKDLK